MVSQLINDMNKENKISHKQQNGNDFIADVSISSFVDQSKYKLIGYQAFYKDGKNKFYENQSDIDRGTHYNPLVDIKQVGKSY